MKFLTLSFCVLLCSCDLLNSSSSNSSNNGVSDSEIIDGLKEALRIGINVMADSAALQDGYWGRTVENSNVPEAALRILLPTEVNSAITTIEGVSGDLLSWKKDVEGLGFGAGKEVLKLLDIGFINDLDHLHNLKDSIWVSLNRAAEKAAPASKAIFVSSITSMSLTDGRNILFATDSSAATGYLKTNTQSALVTAYSPIVDSTLALVKANTLWTDFSSTYNNYVTSYQSLRKSIETNAVLKTFDLHNSLKAISLPADSLPVHLGPYVTEKALDGLFYLVGTEEVRIRRNPYQYGKELLNRVFDLIFKEEETKTSKSTTI